MTQINKQNDCFLLLAGQGAGAGCLCQIVVRVQQRRDADIALWTDLAGKANITVEVETFDRPCFMRIGRQQLAAIIQNADPAGGAAPLATAHGLMRNIADAACLENGGTARHYNRLAIRIADLHAAEIACSDNIADRAKDQQQQGNRIIFHCQRFDLPDDRERFLRYFRHQDSHHVIVVIQQAVRIGDEADFLQAGYKAGRGHDWYSPEKHMNDTAETGMEFGPVAEQPVDADHPVPPDEDHHQQIEDGVHRRQRRIDHDSREQQFVIVLNTIDTRHDGVGRYMLQKGNHRDEGQGGLQPFAQGHLE